MNRMDYTYEQIARMVDHSLLNPVMRDEELEQGCRLADVAGSARSLVVHPVAGFVYLFLPPLGRLGRELKNGSDDGDR